MGKIDLVSPEGNQRNQENNAISLFNRFVSFCFFVSLSLLQILCFTTRDKKKYKMKQYTHFGVQTRRLKLMRVQSSFILSIDS